MVYENALPSDLCDQLIKRFEASPNVEHNTETLEDGLNVRSCLELNSSKEQDFEPIQKVLMKITELAVSKYQSELPVRTFPKEIGCEVFRIKKYRKEEIYNDHFDYHVDVNSYSSARRYLALFWYLNDVAQGGETFFPHPNVRIKPKKGRLLMFPSLWMYPHSGERTISDDKYLLSTFLHYL
jgi:hypothetical protein